MTGIRIPISADASGVNTAFEQIRSAIRRAGQEGKAFADLDLSHPELKGVAEDLKRLQQNYENLRRMGRGATGAAVRGIGADDWLGWYDRHAMAFPDERDRVKHFRSAGGYILNGTGFAPPPPAPVPVPGGTPGGGGGPAPLTPYPTSPSGPNVFPGPRPGGGTPLPGNGVPGGDSEDNPSSFSGLLNALPGVKFALQLAGLQGLASMAGKAHGLSQDELISNDRLGRSLRDTTVEFDALKWSVRKTADAVGISYQETQRYTSEWVKLTNEMSSERATDAVRFAVGVSKGYGTDAGGMLAAMGRVTHMGEDPKRFVAMLGETIASGGLSGKVEETMQAMVRWTETTAQRLVTRSDTREFAAAYASMNRDAWQGSPGLAGAGGERLIYQMNNAVTQGGAAGDASMFVTARALGRAGVTDPYKLAYVLEGGMFGSPKKELGEGSSETNFDLIQDEINRTYKGVPEYVKLNALARYFGISMHQAQAISGFRTHSSLHWLGDVFGKYGLDATKVDPTAYRDIFEVDNTADDGLGAWRDRVKRRSPGDAARLDGLSGDTLRAELVRVLARTGMEKTPGVEIQESIAGFNNALTKIGEPLVSLTTEIRDGVGFIAGKIGDVTSLLAGGIRSGGAPQLPGPRKTSLPALGGTGSADIGTFLNGLEGAESSNGTNMASKTSSARGWHQFLDKTWLSDARRYGGAAVQNLSDEQLLAMRNDREFSRFIAGKRVANEIDPALSKTRGGVTNLGRYAGWHFGPETGAMLMQAPDDTLVETIVGDLAVQKNPYLRGMTVGAWKKRFGGKFGSPTGGPGGTPLPAGATTGGRQQVSGTFGFNGPLQVIVTNPNGDVLQEHAVPVTTYSAPQPIGLG